MSRVASPLSLVAGGASASLGEAVCCVPAKAGAQTEREARAESGEDALRASGSLPSQGHTLSEIFATHPRDAGWCGFLLAQHARPGPVLWVQDRMAILESGRIFPPGLGLSDLIHIEARDAKAALWAMEEGLRCSALSLVVGELWGDPAALDFTATRRLAVAAERHGVAACLIRLGGHPDLSGARMRWRLASLPSAPNPLDPKAPGAPRWDAELFRARGRPPGRWSLGDEAPREPNPQHRLPHFVDGPVEPMRERRSA
jgi:protein ImuA